MLLDLFRHRGWPYPRGKEETWRLFIVLAIVILLSGAGLSFWLLQAKQSPLSREDLRIDIHDLVSYISQAEQLETTVGRQPFTQNYTVHYLEQLQKNTAQIHDTLTKPSALSPAKQLLVYSQKTADILASLKSTPAADGEMKKLRQVKVAIHALENQL